MKLSFPTRFPPAYAAALAGAIFVASWAEGTELTVAALTGTFFLISGLAFDLAGGLTYPSGAFVFFASTLTMGAGVVAKIVMGEPLDSHLRDATKSLLVYNGGMLGIYAAVALNRHLRRQPPLLANLLTRARADQVAMGCILIGIGGPLLLPDSLASIFNQINNFLPFAVMLPVYSRAKETDGASTFSWVAFVAWLYTTVVFGLLTFSKQGIFECSAAWVVAAGAAGYRVSKIRLVILVAVAAAASAILTPYSQIGRQFRYAPDLTDQAIYLLEHPLETRDLYILRSELELRARKTDIRLFDHPEGLLDRLTMLPIDDALIYVTDHGHPEGLHVIGDYFLNAVPHFLWPGKPNWAYGNQFAHEIGLLAPKDHSTGISFSPFGDAYHDGQWMTVLVVAPLMFLMLFFVADSVTGPANQTVWALIYILTFAHSAPEGGMSSVVFVATVTTVGVIFGSWVIARIAPLVGQLITLPKPAAPQAIAARS